MTTPAIHDENARLRALVEVSRKVFASLDLDDLLDNILNAAIGVVGAERGTVYICDPVRQELWSRVSSGGERVEIHLPYGQGIAGHVAACGENIWTADVRDCPQFDPETDRRTGFTTRSAFCMPVRDRDGTTIAVLQLLNKPAGFSAADVEFLELMAGPVAQALANAMAQKQALERQRLGREMELAGEIQRALLPAELPEWPGVQLAAHSLPCYQIGGDYYDAVPLSGSQLLLALADVSGKGIPSALIMSNLQAALWAAAGSDFDLGRWAARMNDTLHFRLGGKKYVTAIFVLLEAEGTRGWLLNAGHPPALVEGPQGMRRFPATGRPLGLLPGCVYEPVAFDLAPGEAMLLFSDGFSDIQGPDGEALGVPGVSALFSQMAPLPPATALKSLFSAIRENPAAESERDDQTALILKAD